MPTRKPRRARSAPAGQDPPTVADVRAIRRRMLQEAGGDVNALMELARREAAQSPRAKSATRKRKPRRAA